MVVDQILLKVLQLRVVQDHLGEFTDPGVDAVHDLPRGDLLLQHGAAVFDAVHGAVGQLDLVAVNNP